MSKNRLSRLGVLIHFFFSKTFLLLFLLTCGNSVAQSISGKVTGIMDGDTFKMLLADSTLVKVRLYGIDSPEKKQPYSQVAKAFVATAIFGKTVCVDILDKDRYRRLVGNVFLADGNILNYELVRLGLAWHYRKYSNDPVLYFLEEQAQKSKLGLWQEPDPISPWEFRASKRQKKKRQ